MNIIKLKDCIMPGNFEMSEFFNTKLKGKYAYFIQMRYIFPINSLCYRRYVELEQLDPIHFLDSSNIEPHIDLYSEEYCMIDFVNMWVDEEATDEANDIRKYLSYNSYSSDADIDMSMIRNFRTWLADALLKFDLDIKGNHMGMYSDTQIYMLDYYKAGMYNEVVRQLKMFGNSNAQLIDNKPINGGCGCCSSNISSVYNLGSLQMCDALQVYKNNLHNIMVQTFEEPDFWKQFNKDFIVTFKKYIDNIIRIGLKVQTGSSAVKYADCNCTDNSDNSDFSTGIFNRLSIALGYIINNDMIGHINYIHDALYDWAEYLYDYMYWPIN